jgi:integral membrane protein
LRCVAAATATIVGTGATATAAAAAVAVAVDGSLVHDARMAGPLVQLRWIALIEAVSYVLLLGVAMPLKYWAGDPRAVKVLGMGHGVLFLLLVWLLARAVFEARWPVGRALLVFVASLVPIWPFVLDRRMREWTAGPAAPPAK